MNQHEKQYKQDNMGVAQFHLVLLYLKPIHGLFSIKNTIFTGKLPQFLGQTKKNSSISQKKNKKSETKTSKAKKINSEKPKPRQ